MYLPPEELKEWVKLFSDAMLGVAALVTAGTAIYGVRMWKHELAGREIYGAAKNSRYECRRSATHELAPLHGIPLSEERCRKRQIPKRLLDAY